MTQQGFQIRWASLGHARWLTHCEPHSPKITLEICEALQKKLHGSGKCKVLILSGMLCTFCPPTIWATSLGFCRNRPESSADKMYRACETKIRPSKRLELYIFRNGLLKLHFRRTKLTRKSCFRVPKYLASQQRLRKVPKFLSLSKTRGSRNFPPNFPEDFLAENFQVKFTDELLYARRENSLLAQIGECSLGLRLLATPQ